MDTSSYSELFSHLSLWNTVILVILGGLLVFNVMKLLFRIDRTTQKSAAILEKIHEQLKSQQDVSR